MLKHAKNAKLRLTSFSGADCALQLNSKTSEFFFPEGALSPRKVIQRTTHMGIGAHPDDLEIFAYEGIVKCFDSEQKCFLGVIVTNGGSSPRKNLYAKISNEAMQKLRKEEQKKAAVIGRYNGVAFLDYDSSVVKNLKNKDPKEDIKELVAAARPSIVYTHNLADKHDTHVAVVIRTIQALRELPIEHKPDHVYGCEVWRDLDWMGDSDKVVLDVSENETLASSLLGVFDSQLSSGKRYDLAATGRRRAHATFYESKATDASTGLTFAMDLTPLIVDDNLDMESWVLNLIDKFHDEVADTLRRLLN